ncbi:MAG: FeS assembly scaffold SufA, partial [Caulobacteraceae bacterium]
MSNLSITPPPRARRERPKVVTLSEAAAERVREIMAQPRKDGAEKPYAGLRVGVKNGG